MAIVLDAASPARADCAVAFAADGNYLRYAAFAAAQVVALTKGAVDVCICSPGDAVPEVEGVRACRIGTGGIFAALGRDPRRTEAAYLRLALPAAFAGQYRRILYMDADVFVQGGDFAALLDVGIGPHPVAAVRDNMQWRTPGRIVPSFRRLGLAAAKVCNSGVLLMDVAAWSGQEVLERCLAFGAQHPPERIGLDQDLLNAVLHGGWAEISPVWNWQYTWASRLFEAMAGAHVVHFIGPKKPWSHDGGELPLRFRRAYRDYFAAHFPEVPVGGDGVAPMANRAFWAKAMGKHLLSMGKMAAYLERFPTDLTVIP